MIADEPLNEMPAPEPSKQLAIPLDRPACEEWALVEIFGHRSHMGRVVEIERFGTKLMRIDVPTDDPNLFETHYYGGGSIFSITPMTETAARAAVARTRKLYGGGSPTISEADEDEPF